MVITYKIKDNLHVNITNSCTNKCGFCVLGKGGADSSRFYLEREPTREEIIEDILSKDLNLYEQLVFSGYGEPTCRLYDMLSVCKAVKDSCNIPISVITNGHASLILGEDTTPLFKGLVDTVYVSLNAPDSDSYMKLCSPKFGVDAYAGVLKFARDITKYVPNVMVTAVEGSISSEDFKRCMGVAEGLGLRFGLRSSM